MASGRALTISTEGVHTLKYWSVDQAGNTEAAKTATVKIDLTKPTIDHTVTPAPNAKGWNNSSVKVVGQGRQGNGQAGRQGVKL